MKQKENWKGKLDSFSLLIWKGALQSLLRGDFRTPLNYKVLVALF